MMNCVVSHLMKINWRYLLFRAIHFFVFVFQVADRAVNYEGWEASLNNNNEQQSKVHFKVGQVSKTLNGRRIFLNAES